MAKRFNDLLRFLDASGYNSSITALNADASFRRYYRSNDKNILVNSIKDWLSLHNKLNSLQKEIKEIRNEKKKLESNLIGVMENNNIDEFTINNGKLMYKKTKTKNPINKEYLYKVLETYFKKNPEKGWQGERPEEYGQEVFWLPIPGRMIMFPSWVRHSVEPNQSVSKSIRSN